MLIIKGLIIILTILYVVSLQALATEYFVSVQGSDSSPGTEEEPFLNIQKAANRMKPGDVCYIKGGRYHEMVRLDAIHGKKGQPIIFKPYQGEKVIIDGSIPIDVKWTHYKGSLYRAKIKKPIWQLFVDGKSMTSARWPNGNWYDGSIWDKTTAMAWPEKGKSRYGMHYNEELKNFNFNLADGGIIIVNSGSFRTYKAFVTEHRPGCPFFSYDTSDVKVHFSYKKKVERHGYFLEGRKELIDEENEWFYDPDKKYLYLWPPNNGNPNNMEIRGKNISYALDGENSSHVVIQGINFFASTFRMVNCENIMIENCEFLYPTYSKRMLGDLSPMDVTCLVSKKPDALAYNTVRNCRFEYMDGPVIEISGKGNLFENNYIHDVDYSCTYEGGWTIMAVRAVELIFRCNTIFNTGASELFKAGIRNIIELNDLSRSGFLQNDGSLIQVSVAAQDQSETRYNWVHHSVKQGIRFDNSNLPNSPWGENGRVHHNVVWQTDRIFFKGDKHYIFNNLSFDSHSNDLITSSNVSINGRNYETVTRNNIANKISGHRTLPGEKYPLPGIADHNWHGADLSEDIRTQLRDPDNLDFRPKAGSDIIDAGVVIPGMLQPYLGKAPDIGPYEYGDKNYWIPGYQANAASQPVPPNHSNTVKADADLMWLDAYKAILHDVYFGTDSVCVVSADRNSEEYKGSQTNNIYHPGALEKGKKYFWRIDAYKNQYLIKGDIWSFRVE